MAGLEEIEEGDRILYNDRAVPLTVTGRDSASITVKGPQGGEYEIYRADDSDRLLVSKSGNRRYSSYVEDLRKVGKWEKTDGKTWNHSKTGAEIRVEKNEAGFWTVKTEGFQPEKLEVPKYGYSNREVAEDEVEKVKKNNPEGN